MVVLGAGLEESNRPDHEAALKIIRGAEAEFYGYVDAASQKRLR